MVKLIAVDMDGTLVNSKKELPQEIFSIIEELAERNIKFVIASGRQYYNLKNAFCDNTKDIIYIAENGAVIYENGKNIYADVMEEGLLARLIAPIRETEDAFPVFCGIKSAYIEDCDAEFVENAQMYFNCESIPNIMDALKVDEICKIAIYDKRGAEENVYPLVVKHCEDVQIVVSGENWADISNKGINKGRAIAFLQKRHQIGKKHCMAFGDFLNDLEMLGACDFSFAMENAHPILKENARFIAKSNDENGVIEVIHALLDGSVLEI